MNCINPHPGTPAPPNVTDAWKFRFEKGISPRQSAKWIPTTKYTDEVAAYGDQREMRTLDPPELKDTAAVRHIEDVDAKQ